MMQKKILIGIWLLQDLLQVLLLGFCLVPNIYITYLLLVTMLDFSNDALANETLLWAFVGGFFYDLRWTNVPGASSLVWCLALTVATVIWEHMPQNTRNYVSYFWLVFIVLIFSEFVHFVFFATSSVAVWRLLLLNMVLSLLVAFISSIVFMRNLSSEF